MKKRAGKKKSFHLGKIQINFTNRLTYTILSVMILVLAGVAVYATSHGVSHGWDEITGIPAGFADGVDDIGVSLWSSVTGGIEYSGGNVGIGTTTPLSKLSVVGDVKITEDLTVDGELKGQRAVFQFGDEGRRTLDAFLRVDGVQMTSTLGYRMYRSGSIVGISATLNMISDGAVGGDTLKFKVYKNGASVFTGAVISGAGGTGSRSASTVQLRGATTFAVGDIISIYVDETGGTFDWNNVLGYFEVVYDT